MIKPACFSRGFGRREKLKKSAVQIIAFCAVPGVGAGLSEAATVISALPYTIYLP
jgi:hypothetical protein